MSSPRSCKEETPSWGKGLLTFKSALSSRKGGQDGLQTASHPSCLHLIICADLRGIKHPVVLRFSTLLPSASFPEIWVVGSVKDRAGLIKDSHAAHLLHSSSPFPAPLSRASGVLYHQRPGTLLSPEQTHHPEPVTLSINGCCETLLCFGCVPKIHVLEM